MPRIKAVQFNYSEAAQEPAHGVTPAAERRFTAAVSDARVRSSARGAARWGDHDYTALTAHVLGQHIDRRRTA